MKIKSIKIIDNKKSKNVLDCFVDNGYRKLHHGSLPDIDTDFDSTKRDDVKAYLERRYNHNGKQRVFSAGTFTTLQVKSVIKDVCRVHRVSVNMANYITAIIDDNAGDWTELMLLAAKEKKVRDFIQKHPDVFEEIRPIMFQPRSEGIHASAVVVTPDVIKGEDVECFDIIPIKKMNGLLVSELSGTELDELGLLKNDLLGIAELSRLDTMIQICNKEYGTNLSIESIATSALDEPKVYEIIRKGLTQGIFQLSSDGMTRYIKSMHPESINDIIAANALFRPATLDSGAAKMYVDAKDGVVDPEYLWGTYDILKDTFGVMCIAYDSLVKTNNGLEKIQDIEPNTYVQTEDGSYHIVLASMYKKCKQIISVRTSFGMEIKCTPDHRVLTQRGWVEAGKLNPKQDFIKCYWMTDDELPFGDMKDWCLGLYLANGNYSQTLNITCRNERDAYIIADRFNEAFGLDCRVYFHTRAWYVSLVNKKCYESSQNAFKKYIKDMGLENMSCYDKNVKRWSLMMLSGFFEGDGCVQNGRIRIKNPKLAMQIFMAAQAARIHSSYYEDIENNDVVYTIALSSLDKLVFQFKEKIQFSFPSGHFIPATCFESFDPKKIKDSEQRKRFYKIRKTNYCRLSTVQNYGVDVEHECWGRVLSIKDNGYEKTYDLSIDKNHSFVVGGHVVHNCYQEDYALISRKIGNLSLGDGVNLVKAISKKKVEKIRKFKDKFYAGAQKNGCPHEVADRIWGIIEGGASYGFNKSHATAYGITAYIGAYIKALYPVAFYTVLLKWGKDAKMTSILQEIRELNNITITKPDINVSGDDFVSNYKTNEIYWSILRIKQVGLKAVDFIVAERNRHGEFTSLEDFIKRIFRNKFKKYKDWDDIDNDDEFRKCPVTALTVKNLILAGAFDKLMNVGSITERYGLMEQAAELLGFKIYEKLIPEDLRDKHWFWGQKQIALTGFGAIDYERIYRNATKPTSLNSVRYFRLEDLQEPGNEKLRVAICATILECTEHKYKDKSTGETKHYGKVTLQQNIDTGQLTIWNDAWIGAKDYFWQKKDRIVIFQGVIKWSDYDEQNVLQINKGAFVMNI